LSPPEPFLLCHCITLGHVDNLRHEFSPNYHHHHHQLANMQLGHPLTRSVLTRPEVCLMVSPGPSAFWSSFLVFSVNCYWGILFTRSNQFRMYSYILSKTWVMFSSSAISVFVYNLSTCILLFFSYHLCCCCSSCVSCFNGPVFTTV